MMAARADLLTEYGGPIALLFANSERLILPAGRWYTEAFGVAFNVETHEFIATDTSAWKLALS